jgi:DNA invertase Pin-like site-specific DNA recombinase
MQSGKNIAYVRTSTIEQNDARQLEALKPYGIDKTYNEKASAKDTNRPQLQLMIDFVRAGDTIYIKDFSRLARSTKDLLDIVETLDKKDVKLVSIKENLDTSTSTGKLMLTMISAIYQFERENLLERQKEGIAIAKEQGKFKGRKQVERPENFETVYSQWKQRNLTGKQAMKELNLKTNTFYKLIKEFEQE